MPIDESLLTCDDTELNQRLVDNGYKLLYTPDEFVYHYRRPNPKRLFKQMYRYAIGRLQVGKRDRRMINPMHILTGLALPAGFVIFIFSLSIFVSVLFLYILLLMLYAGVTLIKTGSIKVSLYVPVVISIILCSWSVGFIRELIFPLKI